MSAALYLYILTFRYSMYNHRSTPDVLYSESLMRSILVLVRLLFSSLCSLHAELCAVS
jgi:hypothetical protein